MNPTDFQTLQEHREYLYEIVRLKLFFLFHWLKEHPEESFESVFNNRIDIYRKSSFNPYGLNPPECDFNQPGWLALIDQVKAELTLHPDDEAAFEAAAFAIIKPTLDARCERDWRDTSYQDGYEDGISMRIENQPNEQGTLSFHIANMIAPESIFADPEYLPGCFLHIIAKARKFGADKLGCDSWLNDYEPWLRILPETWRRSVGERCFDIAWHYGCWGQFINSRMLFNRKAGDYLRRTGKFPCSLRHAECDLNTLESHFRQMLSGTERNGNHA